MQLISVNVGRPREVIWHGKPVTTGIIKAPIAGPVMARTLNLDGDGQADLTVHGGIHKAIYVYPSEHYEYWRDTLPGVDLPWGSFGENFTVEGMREGAVYIGDRYRIGELEVVVTQPRLPCYKLGIRFGRDDMVKMFLASRRPGVYLAVEKEGRVEAGEAIEFLRREQDRVSVWDITRLYAFDRGDVPAMEAAAHLQALPESWREYFRERLEKQGSRWT